MAQLRKNNLFAFGMSMILLNEIVTLQSMIFLNYTTNSLLPGHRFNNKRRVKINLTVLGIIKEVKYKISSPKIYIQEMLETI